MVLDAYLSTCVLRVISLSLETAVSTGVTGHAGVVVVAVGEVYLQVVSSDPLVSASWYLVFSDICFVVLSVLSFPEKSVVQLYYPPEKIPLAAT